MKENVNVMNNKGFISKTFIIYMLSFIMTISILGIVLFRIYESKTPKSSYEIALELVKSEVYNYYIKNKKFPKNIYVIGNSIICISEHYNIDYDFDKKKIKVGPYKKESVGFIYWLTDGYWGDKTKILVIEHGIQLDKKQIEQQL